MPKLFFSRKAELGVLVTLIIVVMAAVPLIYLGYKIVMGSDDMNNDEKCRLSIFAADQMSKIKKSTADAVDLVPNLECKPKEVIVKEKQVVRTSGGSIDDDLINGIIANEMYRCWNMVGSGKLDPFRALWPKFDRTYCMTCATIDFDKSLIDKAKKESYRMKGLRFFLATKRIPGSQQSFYQYMYGKEASTKELEYLKAAKVDEWPLDKSYSIIWRFERQDKSLNPGLMLWEDTVALTTDIISTQFIGFTMGQPVNINSKDSVWVSQGVYFLPRDDLSGTIKFKGYDEKDTCTMLLN
jgi:hypothetical protein